MAGRQVHQARKRASVVPHTGLFLLPSLNPTGSPSLEQFPGTAIPTLGNHPSASGGSGEAGRGIGRANLRLSGYKRRASSALTWKGLVLAQRGRSRQVMGQGGRSSEWSGRIRPPGKPSALGSY